ncbi:MAG: hypothetical protein EOO93_02625 [Pedobacter sp.]|uniref:MaoC/PaaZ C-terminal domain-containing protein n=1 Tax=Pedobacter agri TaxID=454586 RepID=UPI00120A4C47|nr:MaoC/PaaZ C-terminal domain-containing protein [Pedobacter agri]RZL69064.1 MAG: hypothetical protein EOO93_02625 [Pedobacter sp.]
MSFLISEDIYNGFISLFKDKNPLHTDEQFANSRGFAGRVMHGNILNGFISYFIGECLPTKNVIIHTQEIQFKNPVYLHDKIFFDASVSDVIESVNAIQFKYFFRNNTGKIVAKGKIQIGMFS